MKPLGIFYNTHTIYYIQNERTGSGYCAILMPSTMQDKITNLKTDGSDIRLIYLYQEHLADLKRKRSDLRNEILTITPDISDSLIRNTQTQDEDIFVMSAKVKELLFLNPTMSLSHTASPTGTPTLTTGSGKPGVKLPKIDVPIFDGELLHWQTFWEQFSISVEKQYDISSTENLVYLCHAVKDDVARSTIESLSHTGDQSEKSIDLLKAHPLIIHQAHVRKIYEVPNLNDGSGKEIRCFHDTVQLHLRALTTMKEEPTGSLITVLLELKLDKETMLEWQKASQDTDRIPHYESLLKF